MLFKILVVIFAVLAAFAATSTVAFRNEHGQVVLSYWGNHPESRIPEVESTESV